MPYEIKKVKGGYKVQKKYGELTSTGRRYFSNEPLTEEGAKAQMKALYASEGRRMASPTRKRFSSPKRSVKSPTRRRKPMSPKRKQKKQLSPKPRKRMSSPKYKRK